VANETKIISYIKSMANLCVWGEPVDGDPRLRGVRYLPLQFRPVVLANNFCKKSKQLRISKYTTIKINKIMYIVCIPYS
jgi:hypothetical protein